MKKIKCMAVPQRSVPYQIQARVDNSIEIILENGVIEEYPSNEPASWVFSAVTVPKDTLHLTLDHCDLNKASTSTTVQFQSKRILKLSY